MWTSSENVGDGAGQQAACGPCALESLARGGHQGPGDRVRIAGIRVNALSPGIVRTPILTVETIEAMAHLQRLGRVAEVDDIARGVLYLEASPLVTGELLHIDGGRSAGH